MGKGVGVNGHSKKIISSFCVEFTFSRFSGFLPLPKKHAF